MTLKGAEAMKWIKQHVALVVLLLVLGTGVTLFITGRLQLNSGRGQKNETGEKGGEKG